MATTKDRTPAKKTKASASATKGGKPAGSKTPAKPARTKIAERAAAPTPPSSDAPPTAKGIKPGPRKTDAIAGAPVAPAASSRSRDKPEPAATTIAAAPPSKGNIKADTRPAAAKSRPSSLGAPIAISTEERENMIRMAAYFKAEKRSFAPGYAEQDWADAEREVDDWLRQQRRSG